MANERNALSKAEWERSCVVRNEVEYIEHVVNAANADSQSYRLNKSIRRYPYKSTEDNWCSLLCTTQIY
jgi:hypothetical protein